TGRACWKSCGSCVKPLKRGRRPMPGIMADNDIGGHFEQLTRVLAAVWETTWEEVGYTVETFESLELPRNLPDRQLWQMCQARQVVLITGNRNSDDPDALEATLRDSNTAESLPLFTIADL